MLEPYVNNVKQVEGMLWWSDEKYGDEQGWYGWFISAIFISISSNLRNLSKAM